MTRERATRSCSRWAAWRSATSLHAPAWAACAAVPRRLALGANFGFGNAEFALGACEFDADVGSVVSRTRAEAVVLVLGH